MRDLSHIVFAAGLGSTGSSALVDLLREFDGVSSPADEFRLIVDPGGLVNLRDAMTENWSMFQCDAAIRSFRTMVRQLSRWGVGPYYGLDHSKYFGDQLVPLTDAFLDELTTVEFQGLWYGVSSAWRAKTNFLVEALRRRRFNSVRMSIGPKLTEARFDELASEYLGSLSDRLLRGGETRLCLNENLSCMFPEKILSMAPGARMILVVRDPKDVYADSLRVRWLGMPEGFDDYLRWQKAIYDGWLDVEAAIPRWDPQGKRVMVVRFEDLVQDYDRTRNSVMAFLGLEEREHVRQFEYLTPERSAKNIGQWKRILGADQAATVDRTMKRFMERYDYTNA